MIQQADTLDFIACNGEMARLIREKDWEQTAVGAPDQWPQSLRTILGVVLHSKFPMFVWWGPELICFYNDAYRPSLGKEGKHPGILGQPAMKAWAEIWPVIYPLIEQVLQGGEATWSEDQLIPIYRNGTLEDVYWTFSYSCINNDEGTPYGILVTCVETTQKVLNQKKLEEIADLLQFSTDAAELGTWDYNPKTQKFTANGRLKSWFGLAKEEETDLQVAIDAIASKDQPRVTAAMSAALDYAQQKPYDLEYTIINRQTGKEIIVLVRGKAYFDDTKTAYRFSGTMEDITEHAKNRTILADAQERARLAVAAGNMGTFDLEIGEKNAVISDRFCEIFDVTPDAAHEALVERIHSDDVAHRHQAVNVAIETGHLHYEVRVVHRDGSIHWVRADGKVIRNTDNPDKPARMIGTVMDITDLKQMEQKREEYIAIASHELKNPLTSLKLALEMMSGIVKEPTPTFFLNKSRDQVNRLISLTSELLNVSKISSGVLEINPEVFHLGSAITESIATVEGVTPDQFQVSGNTDISVLADRFRIEQVLINLLSNAVKYSPKGTPVFIDVQREPGWVTVAVRDKGIGIDEDKISFVFQKFSRLEHSHGIDGYGLGLYITEQIIRRHGGEIGVKSEKGKGSTFWFRLPH